MIDVDQNIFDKASESVKKLAKEDYQGTPVESLLLAMSVTLELVANMDRNKKEGT